MAKEINFCKCFIEQTSEMKDFENKLRFHLEEFFFNYGWASKTNPKVLKEGYCATSTYNYDDIKHFIEDMVRWSNHEFGNSKEVFKISEMKVDEKLLKKQIKLVLESNIKDPDKNGIHNLLGSILDAIDQNKRVDKMRKDLEKKFSKIGKKKKGGV